MTTSTSPLQPDLLATLKKAARDARAKVAELGGYALLIGPTEYADPAVTNLRGGKNDVLAYWKVCRKLGYKRIRALTTPTLSEDDLVKAEMELRPELAKERHVTEAEVRADVRRWLEAGKAAEPAGEVSDMRVGDLDVRVFDKGARRLSDDVIASVGEPTSENLVRGVEWLADRLMTLVRLKWTSGNEERTRWEQWPAFPGLLVYSGHGARQGNELYLCPSDTLAKGLANAVSFSKLRDIFDRTGDLAGTDPELVAARPALQKLIEEASRLPGWCHPTDNLTVLLDCCYAGRSQGLDKPHQVPTITPGEMAPRQGLLAHQKLGNRVFCAAGRAETAYQALLGGEWHGAFSWAFTTALEQWSFVDAKGGGFRRTNISHAELLFRARALLEALSFPQHPVLLDQVSNRPVFWHDAEQLTGDETANEPTAQWVGGQVDPIGGHNFTVLELWHSTLGMVAKAIIPNGPQPSASNPVWEGTLEYWKAEHDVDTSMGSWLLKVSTAASVSDYRPDFFAVSQAATWREASTWAQQVHIDHGTNIFGVTGIFRAGSASEVTWFSQSASNLRFEPGQYELYGSQSLPYYAR